MKKLIPLVSFLLTFDIFSQYETQYLSLLNKAESHSYNFNFDSSQVYISKALTLTTFRPEAFLIKSKIHLWYFLGGKEKVDYDYFMNLSDSAEVKIETMLKEAPEDPYLLYLLGNVYKYRAMAHGTNGNTLDAFWSTKKSVSYFEDVIEIDSTYYSAYGGVGVFEYALSYVPALFNWALSISGLTADQENGFEYIKLASQLGELDKTEYQFHLAKLYDEHLGEYEKSLEILHDLIKYYPSNQLFHYQAAIEHIKSKNLDKALVELEKVLEISNPKFTQTTSFSNFLIGDIYFRLGDFEESLKFYNIFLTTTNTIDYTGIASLRSAYCYYFLGNDLEFRRYALLAANGNLDLEDDSFARERSLFILKNGFTEETQTILKITNSFLRGDLKNTLLLIEENIDSLNNENDRAQALIYKSAILIEVDSIVHAKQILRGMDSLEVDIDQWVEPLRYYYLAMISFKENNYINARKYLELAEDKNDYQKSKEIDSYINGLRRKLNK